MSTSDFNNTRPFLRIIQWLIGWSLYLSFGFFSLAASLASIALAGTGIYSILDSLQSQWSYGGKTHGSPDFASDVLGGLEMLFLAPLPFAIVKFLGIRLGDIAALRFDGTYAMDRKPIGDHELKKGKALAISLMAAIVATDLVKRALSPSGLTWEPALCAILLILVLAAYSWLIEQQAGHGPYKTHVSPEAPAQPAADAPTAAPPR